VKRLNADVGAVQAALQQRPEVLDEVRVDVPVHVGDSVIDGAMVEVLVESGVGRKGVV